MQFYVDISVNIDVLLSIDVKMLTGIRREINDAQRQIRWFRTSAPASIWGSCVSVFETDEGKGEMRLEAMKPD